MPKLLQHTLLPVQNVLLFLHLQVSQEVTHVIQQRLLELLLQLQFRDKLF